MNVFKRALPSLLLVLCASFAVAQDCQLNPTQFTAAARSTVFDNRSRQCVTWVMSYTCSGFSPVSAELDFAPDNGGAAGSWSAWPNTDIAQPLTSTTEAQVTGYKYHPWVSINFNTLTGTGSCTAIANGWRAGSGPAQLDANGDTVVSTAGKKNTYRAFASFTAAAGDIALLPGSATKTINVTRVEASCSTSGTAALADLQLVKRSAADTGGTSGAMTAVPLDASDAAATAAPLNYTVAPTPGAAVGAIAGGRIVNGSATLIPTLFVWQAATGQGGKLAILRGTAQVLAVNLSAVVVTQTCDVAFEWTEE